MAHYRPFFDVCLWCVSELASAISLAAAPNLGRFSSAALCWIFLDCRRVSHSVSNFGAGARSLSHLPMSFLFLLLSRLKFS